MPSVITRIANNLNSPQDVAVDASGNLYVANGGTNQILKLTRGSTPSGLPVAGVGTTIAAGQNPTSVAVDSSGNVFAVYNGLSTVFKNNQVWAQSPHLKEPTGLAADSAGNVYVSCAGNNSIVYISAT